MFVVWRCYECNTENETAVFGEGIVTSRCKKCGVTHKIMTESVVTLLKYGRDNK